MPIRVSGLISGLDTDSIVQELVSAYSTKKEKYEKAQTKLEWKMDSWKTMNSKIYGFYTSSLSGMRMSSAYNLKTSTVSNSNVAKVTASSSAVSGTQKLKVKSLASSGYMTGGVVKQTDGSKVEGGTLLSDMGISAGSKLTVNDGTKDTEIEITDGMTVNQLVAGLKDAGVSANFDETNQRFFINSTKSGAEGEFSITAANADGLSAIQSLGLFATKDVDGNETADMKKYRELAQSGTGDQQSIAAAVVAAVDGTTSYTSQELAAFNSTISNYENQKSVFDTYEAKRNIVSNYDQQSTTKTNLETILATDSHVRNNGDGTYTLIKDNGDAYTDDEIAEMKSFNEQHNGASGLDQATIDKMNENAQILASKTNIEEYEQAKATVEDQDNINAYNEANTFVNTSSNQTAYTYAETYINDAANIAAYNTAKTAVNSASAASFTSDAARISGQDSEIELNGATFTSSTGTFSINGLSITATQVTGNDEVSITTATDTQAVYDKIKSFLGKYNELITAMDTAYNAASAGDYEPLTDDEKEDMSDKEIEKWETKIKDSLLRRDSTLGNTSSSMKSIMSSSFEINGKTYSLSDFGINTGGYFASDTNERGCLHIDGDPDDTTTSGNTDKLMAAINEDPEAVTSFFQQLSSKLYDDLTKRMSSSSVSSVYTIYNDKQMSSEYSDYKDKIDKWQDKLDYYEEFYYKKFSSMETALSKLQSSTSSLSGLLGS